MTVPRVAVVTGAGRGIGQAIARVLHRDGLRVVVVDRHDDRARSSAKAVGDGADWIRADVGDPDDVGRIATTVVERHGRWDVLVNNAAALRTGSLTDTTLEEWNAVLAGTVTTAWLCTQAAAGPMRDAGGGRIINISSIVAQGAPSAGLVAYTAAKAALHGLTISAARELGPDRTTVNCVSPGAVVTDAWSRIGDPEAMRAERSAAAVLGRVAEPREIGEAVRYLASTAAGFVTGQTLVVDGGRTDKL
jgi:NAD(P)-dependent dehydrogenase (short-subunit alcohol dehydrogenase family)